MLITLIALAVSTVLNAIYFLRLVITIYRPREQESESISVKHSSWNLLLAIICFIVLNLVLGMGSQPIIGAIRSGLEMFG